MSDAQLIAFFKNPKASVCGRFNQEQLEKDVLIPRKRIPWVKYFFQFSLPAFLLSLKSSGQTGKIKLPVEKIAVQKKSLALLVDTMVYQNSTTLLAPAFVGRVGGVISYVQVRSSLVGTVTDNQGNPLAGATISVGDKPTKVADRNGNFWLDEVSKGASITASFVGYQSKEITVNNVDKPLYIKLIPHQTGLVEVVVRRRSVAKMKNKKSEACTKPVETKLSFYPNPLKSSTPLHLKWQNLEAGNYLIEIFNTGGVLMKSEKLVVEKGLQETSIMINELPAGNYFVRLINEKAGWQMSQQIIVQN